MISKRKVLYSTVLLFYVLCWRQGLAQQTFEKSFSLAFPNSQSNQVAYLQFPSGIPIWGYLEIEITGGYNHQINQGLLRKRIDIVFSGYTGHFLSQESHIEVASGLLADQWQIGDFESDTYRIPIYHLVPTGNDISVNIRGNFVHEASVNLVKSELAMTTLEQKNNTDLHRAYRNFKDSRIGIGTDTPRSRLDVNGDIRAREIKVETANWPDYVFQPDYDLKSLSEVAKFIKKNGHLPEVPKASEVEAEGVSLGEMSKILLKKVEELTLHLIEIKEELEVLKGSKK